MKGSLWVLVVTALIAGAAQAQDNAAGEPGSVMVEFVPERSEDVLFNPRVGLYMQHPPMELPANHWLMQIADIAYYRLDWARLNPEEGIYAFDEYFGPMFDLWVKQHGKRVAFRVMCESMHSRVKYVTPQWVFDKGVPGVEHVGIGGQEQIDPVFWDERYLDIQCEFIRKLGEYLDGREGLEFLDIGSIGEWGEMHLGLHIRGRWTRQQLEATGYTHTKYVMAYRRIIDAFAQAFPRTQIFLNVGGQSHHTINDYAALRGVHFRQDGLSPRGASANVGEWLYKPYARRGVVCNFEFHSGYRSMQQKGWDLKETVDRALEVPTSYLNSNLGCYGDDVPDEVVEQMTRAARTLGYRFVPVRVFHLPTFHLNGVTPARIPVRSVWRNDGIAPCYESYALEWSLVNAQGETVASAVDFPRVPTTEWWPGEGRNADTLLRAPADLPVGAYTLTVAVIDPTTGEPIQLGIAGRGPDGRYSLCTLEGVPGEAPTGPVFAEGFEDGSGGWSTIEGMTVSVDDSEAHGGGASLLIEGRHERGWNYASSLLPDPVVPSARYKLTTWMMVEAIKPARHAPYMKIGVNDTEGTWQELEVTAELPPEAGTVHFAVEKGAYGTPITVRLRLDDVELELLEAP